MGLVPPRVIVMLKKMWIFPSGEEVKTQLAPFPRDCARGGQFNILSSVLIG